MPHLRVRRWDFTRSLANDLIHHRGQVISALGWHRIAKERFEAMTDMMVAPEEEILSYEVSDEALEATAATDQAGYTLGACTGLSVCPD
jgi:hypothetical protein